MNPPQPPAPDSSDARPRCAIVLDSPNHYRGVKALHGPEAEPDWEGLLREARLVASVTPVAVVNSGARPDLWNRFEDAGWDVVCSDAPDCDEMVIAQIVRTSLAADIVVIGGGDHKYADVAALLKQVGKRVIVTAVRGSVARDLLDVSDDFVDLPVILKSEFSAEDGALCAA